MELITSGTVSAAASLDLTAASMFDGTYDRIDISVNSLIPATDAADFLLRVSEDGGSTFKSGASDYRWCIKYWIDANDTTGAEGVLADNADTAVKAIGGAGASAGESANTTITFTDPGSTANWKVFLSQAFMVNSAGMSNGNFTVGVYYGTTNAIDAVQLIMSTGNIASMTYTVIGHRTS